MKMMQFWSYVITLSSNVMERQNSYPKTFYYDAVAISMKYYGNMWKKSWKWENFEVTSEAYGLIPWVIAVELV